MSHPIPPLPINNNMPPLLLLQCGNKRSFGVYSPIQHRYVVGDVSISVSEVTGYRLASKREQWLYKRGISVMTYSEWLNYFKNKKQYENTSN